MASQRQSAVAEVYAKAIFELAQEAQQTEKIQQELSDFLNTLKDSTDLKRALNAFMFSVTEKQSLIEQIAVKLSLSPLVVKFLNLLVVKNRMLIFELIFSKFQALVDESQNIIRGVVTTVEAMSDSEKTGLSQTFSKKLNKKVILEQAINKNIIGGLIVTIQGLTFDGSLRTSLHRLKETLERQSV